MLLYHDMAHGKPKHCWWQVNSCKMCYFNSWHFGKTHFGSRLKPVSSKLYILRGVMLLNLVYSVATPSKYLSTTDRRAMVTRPPSTIAGRRRLSSLCLPRKLVIQPSVGPVAGLKVGDGCVWSMENARNFISLRVRGFPLVAISIA